MRGPQGACLSRSLSLSKSLSVFLSCSSDTLCPDSQSSDLDLDGGTSNRTWVPGPALCSSPWVLHAPRSPSPLASLPSLVPTVRPLTSTQGQEVSTCKLIHTQGCVTNSPSRRLQGVRCLDPDESGGSEGQLTQ